MSSIVLAKASQQALVLLLFGCSLTYAGTPDWVTKRPIVPGLYIGIGMMQKLQSASEYSEAAKNIALNDIASQITVSISSEVLRNVFESNERLGEEFQSQIRASAKADLEGVQLVDTYETDDEYWVYMKLSKAEYEARRAAKMRNAVAMSFDLFTSGTKCRKEQNITRALGYYAQAFGPIEKYLTEPVTVQFEGRDVLLVNELYGSLQKLLGGIEVNATDEKRDAKISRPLKKPLAVVATLDDAAKTPVVNLPFTFRFVRGAGELVDRAQTDHNGVARCDVHKITATERIQTIEAKLDLGTLAGNNIAPAVQTILGSLPLPTARFVLNVSGVDVFVDACELMFDQKLERNRVEPVLKSLLGENGFAFVDDRSKASLVISVRANARKGSEVRGLAFSFVSVTVSVLDLETHQEIFQRALEDVKEGSNSFEKAAMKGFQTAAERIAEELLPELVEKVQR